ncbi:MAG: 30S ribosomal protein S20 [Deltaproteobacteria bacterium]|nr:30S ribosomal protein S20 [Deltaproteobacteria bacterium]
MIVHKSVVKRSRQALKHRERNVAVKSSIRTGIKTVLEAVESKDPEAAKAALAKTVPAIAKAAAKGAFHKKAASRKTSRLTKHVNSLKA